MSLPSKEKYDILVVGGGFFGLNVAEHFAKAGKSVVVCEREDSTMHRASYVNQARIHNGYHYPRSVITAKRSHDSFFKFINDFTDCVDSSFEKYYGIGKILGKVNAKQYKEYCSRMCDVCEEAPYEIQKLCNLHFIEKIFKTREYAFDAVVLNKMMLERTANAGVEVQTSCVVRTITKKIDCLEVEVESKGHIANVRANHVFNCTYANLNFINANSVLEKIPLKYEMTEMCLVDVPDEIKGKAFTIMCGPFFSIMPFPAEHTYSLSHVRYTPHYEWQDTDKKYMSPLDIYSLDKKQTAYAEMIHDASRYIPALANCEYKKSIWDVKTVLPMSERDDSRPILFKMNYSGIPGYHCIMGGKLDNIYDVIKTIENNQEIFK